MDKLAKDSEASDTVSVSSLGVESPELQLVAKAFAVNIKNLNALLAMPKLLYSFAVITRRVGRFGIQVAIESMRPNADPSQIPDDLGKDKMAELFSQSVEEFDKKVLSNPQYGPDLLASMRVLRLSVLSGSWTAFECVATDCWEAALNRGHSSLARRALSTLPDEPGEISSRQIPVGLAARHNFDLRNCLGSILKTKFDFTSVSGIKKAFKSAFSETDELFELLDEPLLTELEATRHLIVHRAGVVDEEFKRRAGAKLPIGTLLEFDDSQVKKFSDCAAQSGTAILLFTDDWLKENS